MTMNESIGIKGLSLEDRRRTRSERLGAAWEAYDSPCLPLSQPSKSLCKIRLSFETPEARNSFCLGAYRPNEGAAEAEDAMSELCACATPLVRQASLLPPSGRSNLPRTDAPLSRFAPATDITSQRRHSMTSLGADIAAEERRMSLELSIRNYSAPSRVSIDEAWGSWVNPQREVNPFDNYPNTAGFFH